MASRVLSEAEETARAEKDLTEQKSIQKRLELLMNPEHLLFGIGLSQVLDSYAAMSLSGQKLWKFPGSVCIEMTDLKQQLEKSASVFVWSEEDLKITSIGNPSIHVKHLENGLYKTSLTEKVKVAAAIRLNMYNLKDYTPNPIEHGIISQPQEQQETLVSQEDIPELEMPVSQLTENKRSTVESQLQNICRDLLRAMETRFSVPDVVGQSIIMFHNTNWFQIKELSQKQASDLLVQLLPKLKNDEMALKVTQSFEEVLSSYLEYLDFKNKTPGNKIEQLYERFYQTIPKPDVFLDLFEVINIKSYSEAYCESVGSLMNILVNKGCNLHPVNFSKELQIAFNSPPFHIMKQSIIPYVVDKLLSEGKEFKRKLDGSNRKSKLSYPISASLGNFRKKEEEDAHVPIAFFK